MKRLLLLAAALLPLSLFAQPGYAGRKLAIMYNNSFSPVLSDNSYTYNGGHGFMAFNSRNILGLDYVRGRRRSIGIALHYFRTASEPYQNRDNQPVIVDRYNYYINQNNDTTVAVSPEHEYAYFPGNIQVGSAGFSVYWKFFGKDFLAPLGSYHRIDFGIMKYWVINNNLESVSLTVEDTYYDDNYWSPYTKSRTITVDAPGDDQVYSKFMFAYTLGKQRIINDAIILDMGVRVGAMFNFADPMISSGMGYEAAMRTRINSGTWFGFNLGIGYLANR